MTLFYSQIIIYNFDREKRILDILHIIIIKIKVKRVTWEIKDWKKSTNNKNKIHGLWSDNSLCQRNGLGFFLSESSSFDKKNRIKNVKKNCEKC